MSVRPRSCCNYWKSSLVLYTYIYSTYITSRRRISLQTWRPPPPPNTHTYIHYISQVLYMFTTRPPLLSVEPSAPSSSSPEPPPRPGPACLSPARGWRSLKSRKPTPIMGILSYVEGYAKKPHGASRLPAPKFPTVVAAPLSALPPPPPLSRPCLASSRASSNMNIFRQVNLQRLTYLYLSVMCVRAWGMFFWFILLYFVRCLYIQYTNT